MSYVPQMQAPTVFVCAAQGAGKNLYAPVIARLFGCTQVVEEWCRGMEVPPGSLVLTNELPDLPDFRRAAEIDELCGALANALRDNYPSERRWVLLQMLSKANSRALLTPENAWHVRDQMPA